MDLRLEDLQTDETHVIDGAGATLGRDSRRSSITIPDPGVSGAHARIFSRSGRYYLEDTNSSNGTFVEGNRLRGELELKDGIVISLHKYKFRVTLATNGVAASNTGKLDEGSSATAKLDPKASAMQKAPTVMNEGNPDTAAIEGLDDPIMREGSSLHRISKASSERRRRDADLDADEPSSSGMRRREVSLQDDFSGARSEIAGEAIQIGFSQALAYYIGAVPRLAFAPVSATQQLIAEQPFPAMEKMDLVGWAAPPLLLGALVTVLASIALSLATHTFGMSAIMRPVISGAISVAIGSLVAGWVWHPLVEWWMRLLKGDSNARGRTNMMIGVFTSAAVVQIVAGVGVLFALLAELPSIGSLLQVVPLFLTAFAGLLSLYVLYAWHGHFRVMDLVPKVIMLLGVLLIANAAWGAVGLMRARAAAALAAASAKRSQELAAQAQAQADVARREAQARAAQADSQSQLGAAQAQGASADAPTPSQLAGSRPSSTAQAPSREATPREPLRPSRVEAEDAPASSSGRGRPLPTFAELNEHIDAIEKAVTADPSLLARMENALVLYKKMHATQAKYHTKAKDQVSERIRQAELYGAIVDTVEELYDKVNGR